MKADKVLKSNIVFDSISDEPFAGGVAISGNKIAAVVRGECINEYIGPDTQVFEYEDKLIMPGFIDAHQHYVDGAINNSEHLCTDILFSKSEEDCVRILKEYAETHPEENTIRGSGWLPAIWDNAPLPDKKSLDEAFPDKPVFLISADFHTMWLNSKACEIVGVSPDWELKSSKVGVFENGEPNGLLFEPEAWTRAKPYMYNFTDEQWIEMQQDILAESRKWGITGISDMSGNRANQETADSLKYIKQIEADGELTSRIYYYLNLEDADNIDTVKAMQGEFNTDKFKINGLKGFIDGTTSTRTAYMLEPYYDDASTSGDLCPLTPREIMEPRIIKANKEGFQVRIHSIGDAAVRMCLDMYEASKKANGDRGLNNTVEHIEQINMEDVPRFAEIGAIPSMQPMHLTLDENEDISEKVTRFGMEKAAYEWIHKTILRAGGELAFGTDYPVVGFNPFVSVHSAVSRVNPQGKPVCVNPWECIEVADALKAYTTGSAKAYNMHECVGKLQEGMLADIVVVDRNLFTIPINDIQHAKIEMTVFDGNVVYTKE